jgi:predicted GIY-YIG superfamily endonuclease
MITYIAIRLSNGDYYWGSTNSLEHREYRHRKSKAEDWFHRSLRKHPGDWVFTEVWNENDPKRSTEQKMLDLHHGRPGCLNHSPVAGGGKIPGSGWGIGENNIAKRPEVAAKISLATRGKPHNVQEKFRKPWANSMANKDLWRNAQHYLSLWETEGKPTSGKFAKLLGTERGVIRKMTELFQKGWIPCFDEHWVQFIGSA